MSKKKKKKKQGFIYKLKKSTVVTMTSCISLVVMTFLVLLYFVKYPIVPSERMISNLGRDGIYNQEMNYTQTTTTQTTTVTTEIQTTTTTTAGERQEFIITITTGKGFQNKTGHTAVNNSYDYDYSDFNYEDYIIDDTEISDDYDESVDNDYEY